MQFVIMLPVTHLCVPRRLMWTMINTKMDATSRMPCTQITHAAPLPGRRRGGAANMVHRHDLLALAASIISNPTKRSHSLSFLFSSIKKSLQQQVVLLHHANLMAARSFMLTGWNDTMLHFVGKFSCAACSYILSAGELGLASNVVHRSWGAGQWSLFVFLMTTPRGPWLGAPVRTLAPSKTA
jgi:hypothetical protein